MGIYRVTSLTSQLRGFRQARVLHHAVERMRVLMSQVDLLTKENARLARTTDQLWDELRVWKSGGQATAAKASTGAPNAAVTAAANAAAAQLQQIGNATPPQRISTQAHLLPFLLPPNFPAASFPTFSSAAPHSPQQHPSISSSQTTRLDQLNYKQKPDSDSSSTTSRSPPPLALQNGVTMDLSRNMFLNPTYSSMIPANSINLSPISAEALARGASNLHHASLSALGTSNLGLVSLGSLGNLNDFLLANMPVSTAAGEQPKKS